MPRQSSVKKNPRRRKHFRAGLSVLLAIYIAVCVYFYVCQEWHFFEPNVDPTSYRESTLQEVPFELMVEGQNGGPATIHYRKYVTTTTPRNEVVFYLHGNKGNMDLCESQIEFLLELGYDVWTMDYRGYGDSTGKLSEVALKNDVLAVYDVITKALPEERIVIWGRSFGSGVAASVAATTAKKPKMLVLETPYWSLVDVLWQKYLFLPPMIFRYELPVHTFLKSASCPIHLIHGTQDEKISFHSSERLYGLCKAEGIKVTGYSIMCGKHDLRDQNTEAEFEEIAAKILK